VSRWRPSLDDYDRSGDATPQARAYRRYARGSYVSDGPVLHCGGCWCGGEYGHTWPGSDDGTPHPRDWPGRVNGHPFREAAPGD